ncbi:MAG: tripartite tricarboxylate transporter substrate binding protein [Rhizobiales bacterium]|nr:tripartite tricarboxylate transporter substrate binding protein [Hyphomicrobiales bacterium]
MPIPHILLGLFLAATTLFWPSRPQAQAYPNQTIKIIVPATPGGAIDVIARRVADKLQVSMGQAVVVENRPGASNNLGTDVVAKSAPDGYTLVIVASSHATNKHLFRQLPYDPIADFEPVAFTHVVPLVLAVHPSVPATTVPELIAWIKANPATATYASSGKGSSLHMAAELFMAMTGTRMLHVPYRGSTAAHADLLVGRTQVIFDTITAILPHVQSGGVRALAVTTTSRSPSLPAIPTLAETGLAGYDANTWGGILAPAGTPRDIVLRLNREINAALEAPDVRAALTTLGIEIQGGPPERFAAYIRQEVEKWGQVVAAAGITPD